MVDLVDHKRQARSAAMASLLAMDIGPVDWEGQPTATPWSRQGWSCGGWWRGCAIAKMAGGRVGGLKALLEALRAEGCQVLDKTDESEYGKSGWVLDPEGNKVELWEPRAGQ